MQGLLITLFEQELPAIHGAMTASKAQAAGDASHLADREAEALAYILKTLVGSYCDVLKEKLSVKFGHVGRLEERSKHGVLGGRERVFTVAVRTTEVVEEEAG